MDIGKIKKLKGISTVRRDGEYHRLKSALIELAHVVQDMKVSPDRVSTHWEVFWELMDDQGRV